MITEDYVSFEVAKLLKEKRFDENINTYRDDFIQHGSIVIPLQECVSKDKVKTPTLQMAMKWLRDVHRKVINVDYIDFLEHSEVWCYSVLDRNTFHEFTEKLESFTEYSYEEACEEAIKYCLTNLI